MALYTIGYEMREVEEFLNLLIEHKIEVLADIRINPISRKSGFSKKLLGAALKEKGIEYIHFRELGTPQPIRDRLHADWDWDRFFREYEAYVITQRETLRRLAKLAKNRRTCIMCFERDFNECHRKIVALHLEKQFKLAPVHL